MRLIDSLRRPSARYTIDDYASWLNSFQYGNNAYSLSDYGVQQTLKGQPVEQVSNSFGAYAQAAWSNGVIFACLLARQQVFAGVRFAFQRMRDGRPAGLFATPDLDVLAHPHPGGTTQDMLTQAIQDADLAGNWYGVKDTPLPLVGATTEIHRLRPDWVKLLLKRNPRIGTWEKLAYLFYEDGPGDEDAYRVFYPEDVAHFAPRPDPIAAYRGMSWLTPVLREYQVDRQITGHKQAFFENAATPNLAITLDKAVSPERFTEFQELFKASHRGSEKSGETLFLGGGADVTVVGSDFRRMGLLELQHSGETRIAAAAGVPAIIVGIKEGLDSGTYSNYGQAVRRFGDGTMHELWQNFCGSTAHLVSTPSDAELWFDSRDVPFLRQDAKDAAEVAQFEAQTIRTLIEAGFDPATVTDAVATGDFSRLVHTGLVSVQLQPPGTQPTQEAPE